MSGRPVALLTTLLIACTAGVGDPPTPHPPPPSSPVLFPVAVTGMEGEEPLGGRLILQGDCLLVSRVGRKLAIWPEGTSFRPGPGGGAVLRSDGQVLREVGGWVWGDTATVRRIEAEQLVGHDLPRVCGGGPLSEDDYLFFERFYGHPLPQQSDVLFPVADTLGSGDAGVSPARLELRGDCVLLGGRIFVWPWWTSFQLDDQAIVDERGGGVIIRVGDRIEGGGGGVHSREDAESLVGYPLPGRCGGSMIPEDEGFFFIDRIVTEAGCWTYGRPAPIPSRPNLPC